MCMLGVSSRCSSVKLITAVTSLDTSSHSRQWKSVSKLLTGMIHIYIYLYIHISIYMCIYIYIYLWYCIVVMLPIYLINIPAVRETVCRRSLCFQVVHSSDVPVTYSGVRICFWKIKQAIKMLLVHSFEKCDLVLTNTHAD